MTLSTFADMTQTQREALIGSEADGTADGLVLTGLVESANRVEVVIFDSETGARVSFDPSAVRPVEG